VIRIAHLGDNHFDETSRFQECRDVHSWIAREIECREVDLTVSSGDLFERRSTIRERIAAAEWISAVTEHAPLVLVRGNHDATTAEGSDLAVFRKLRTRHPLIIEEAAGVHPITTKRGIVHVGAVAWPQEASAKAALEHMRGGSLSVDDGHVALGELLRNVLRGIGDELEDQAGREPGPRILAMHALVSGSVTSTGQPLIGDALVVGLSDIALARADYVALAHIHKHQHFFVNGAPAVYCGSHYRTAFGEIEPKGFVIADFDGPEWAAKWELVPTPCVGMFLIDEEWGPTEGDPNHYTWLVGLHGEPENDADYQGAEVRFRYRVDSDQRDAARASTSFVREYFEKRGVSRLKVEEVVRPTTRARAPEIAKATTLEDQLGALWATKRPELGNERRARLLSKLGEVRA